MTIEAGVLSLKITETGGDAVLAKLGAIDAKAKALGTAFNAPSATGVNGQLGMMSANFTQVATAANAAAPAMEKAAVAQAKVAATAKAVGAESAGLASAASGFASMAAGLGAMQGGITGGVVGGLAAAATRPLPMSYVAQGLHNLPVKAAGKALPQAVRAAILALLSQDDSASMSPMASHAVTGR